jgi:hypothetical protein
VTLVLIDDDDVELGMIDLHKFQRQKIAQRGTSDGSYRSRAVLAPSLALVVTFGSSATKRRRTLRKLGALSFSSVQRRVMTRIKAMTPGRCGVRSPSFAEEQAGRYWVPPEASHQSIDKIVLRLKSSSTAAASTCSGESRSDWAKGRITASRSHARSHSGCWAE